MVMGRCCASSCTACGLADFCAPSGFFSCFAWDAANDKKGMPAASNAKPAARRMAMNMAASIRGRMDGSLDLKVEGRSQLLHLIRGHGSRLHVLHVPAVVGLQQNRRGYLLARGFRRQLGKSGLHLGGIGPRRRAGCRVVIGHVVARARVVGGGEAVNGRDLGMSVAEVAVSRLAWIGRPRI